MKLHETLPCTKNADVGAVVCSALFGLRLATLGDQVNYQYAYD